MPSPSMLARKRLPQVSERRKADNHEWLRLRQRRLDHDRGECQARELVLDVACWGKAEVHHILPRSRGSLLCDLEGLVTVCAGHHLWISTHSPEAKALGLLK